MEYMREQLKKEVHQFRVTPKGKAGPTQWLENPGSQTLIMRKQKGLFKKG